MMLSELAPAKLNLFLHVCGRLPDGYHLLESLAVFLDLSDRVGLTPGRRFGLDLSGPTAAGLSAHDNLVIRAAVAMAERFGRPADFRLSLVKEIPVAAGLGGGSADAAACIRLIARHWGVEPLQPGVLALAKTLGADVPVCLHSRPALMRGTGEKLAFLRVPDFSFVLLNPGRSVSTKAVFESLKPQAVRQNPGIPDRGIPDPGILQTGEQGGTALMPLILSARNDLQDAAIGLEPEIARCLTLLASNENALMTRMSGSGATCFSLFTDPKTAADFGAELKKNHPDDRVWSGGMFDQGGKTCQTG